MGNDQNNTVSTPKISVVLPVYNGGKTIVAAVKSITSQTYPDFELLAIDDGSKDDTLAKLRSIDDPRLVILSDGVNKGLAARLNEGIDRAKGRYIARMDADDLAFPERFAKQMAFLDHNPQIDLVAARIIVFSPEGNVIGLSPYATDHDQVCARPWKSFYLPHPTWMGRAEWFRKYRYAAREVMRAEDHDLLLRSHRTSRFACLDEVLLAYCHGPFNLSRTLVARKHYLAAQLRFFLREGDYGTAFIAAGITMLKVAVDLAASLPACDKLFFARMNEPVPPETIRQFEQLKSSLS